MRMRRILKNERGQAFILTAVCLAFVITFLGFAIDVGHFRYARRQLQSAADAAALAAALEIRVCGGIENCAAMQDAAQNALRENGFAESTLLANCAESQQDGVTLMLNNPVCAVSGDPNGGRLDYVEAIVSEQVPTYFAGMLGIRSERISARAEAARIGGPCVVALGGPPGGPYDDQGALTLVAGVLLHSNCPIWDESTSSKALECTLSVGVTAPQINVTGGVSGLLGILPSLCGLWTTRAKTGVVSLNPHDPMAYLPAPPNADDPCGSKSGNTYNGSSSRVNILLTGTYIFNPGVYCGGINILAATIGTNITFNPGTYVLRQKSTGLLGTGLLSDGGLNITVSALATIRGQGVTFYSEGGSSSITVPDTLGLSNFHLSAPTSGEYGGVLLYQPSTNSSADVFSVSAAQGSVFDGAIYAPNASVTYGVNVLSSSYNILVARDINFLAGVASVFGNNYAALSSGSPLNGNVVMLVQ